MSTPVLQARGLCVRRAGRPVLHGVDLDLLPGTVTALVGPSGAGKTTLLRALVGFEELDAGSVMFEGRDTRELDARLLRRKVGLVAQSPVMLPGSVRDNLAYGLATSDVAGALDVVGLPADLLERDASELSGGQTARVAIARALTREPVVLLLDEPTASLDAAAADGIEALVADLAADHAAVLVITHDEAQAQRISCTKRDSPRPCACTKGDSPRPCACTEGDSPGPCTGGRIVRLDDGRVVA